MIRLKRKEIRKRKQHEKKELQKEIEQEIMIEHQLITNVSKASILT